MAERHLVAAGFVILDRNWRCRAGEIDIVALDGDVLVVCEVKTRTGRWGTAAAGRGRIAGKRPRCASWPACWLREATLTQRRTDRLVA